MRNTSSRKGRALGGAQDAFATRSGFASGPTGFPPMSSREFALLALAGFAVQLGYGVILPLLPELVQRIGADTSTAAVAVHTSGLTTAYMLAVFAAALPSGRLADRFGGRRIVLIGLTGHSAALVALAAATDAVTAYALRAAAGVFAGAVLAAVAAIIAEERDHTRRARLFAGSGAAALVGLVVGPALSGLVAGAMARMLHTGTGAAMTLLIPFSAAAGIGLAILAAAAVWLKPALRKPRVLESASWLRLAANETLRALLIANFLVLFALGALEVMMPLLGEQRLAFDALALGIVFAECSAVMIVLQGALFASPVLSRFSGGRLAAAAFVGIATGFVWLALAGTFTSVLGAVGFVAIGGGYLLPALGYAASVHAVAGRGEVLGAMTAAGSLGQAAGSAAGGLLYAGLGGAALWAVAAAMLAGVACVRAMPPASPGRRDHAHAPIGHGREQQQRCSQERTRT